MAGVTVTSQKYLYAANFYDEISRSGVEPAPSRKDWTIKMPFTSTLQKRKEKSVIHVRYEGDTTHPAGWEVCAPDTSVYKIVDGNILYLSDSSPEEFQARLMYKWNCNFDRPVTIETRAKIKTCKDTGGCGIYVGDGAICVIVTLFSDRIELSDSKEFYSLDTTDDFHVYKIKINNGRIDVFVDEKPALSSTLRAHSFRDYVRDQVGFGGFGGPGAGWWDYFRFKCHEKTSIRGGIVTFDDLSVVRIDTDPLNFPFAQRFADGTIWLEHSMGQHVVDEDKSTLWSLDDGKTWSTPNIEIKTMDACQLQDGSVISLDCWEPPIQRKHTAEVHRWPSPRSSQHEVKEIEIVFPYPANLFLHRSAIVLRDGRLLACGYGMLKNGDAENRAASFFFESKDAGNTWQFLSEISGECPGAGGYSEPSLLALEDGSILCLMRTAGSPSEWANDTNTGPLMQSKSVDGGRTWSTPVVLADYGVNPHAIQLSDGTLVAASGRPGLYLLVDFTGTAEHWQKRKVYSGSGSSYPSLMEIGSGKVLLLYDESAFCLNAGASVFNRIMCMTMTIKKDQVFQR